MAYVAGDVAVEIKGTTLGGEIWSNSWAAEDVVDATARTNLATRFHQFYDALSPALITDWHASTCLIRDLFANVTYEMPWEDIPGENIDGPLPQQVSVRVSLSAGANARGGPFICGWPVSAVDANGLLDVTDQTLVADEVEDLGEGIDGDGMALGLHSPTSSAVLTVFQARVGQRFDVIRKRSNDILEAYVARPIP